MSDTTISAGCRCADTLPSSKKPLPQWPYCLSVNTLLSIYIVVMKAALMYVLAQGIGLLKWSWLQLSRPLYDLVKYDEASRGALGSLLLLSTTHIRHLLSSLGAVLVAALIVLDPVTQEIIRYYGCTITMGSTKALVPRTRLLTSGPGAHIAAGLSSIAPAMQAAVNAGVSLRQHNFSCQTGNCIFPAAYSSVGPCSQCRDMRDQVALSYWCWGTFESEPVLIGPDDHYDGAFFTNTSLPSGSYVPSTMAVGQPNVSVMGYMPESDLPIELLAAHSPVTTPRGKEFHLTNYFES